MKGDAMPDPERASHHQTAVVWAAGAPNKFGQPTVGAPCQIKCRMEFVNRQLVRPDGTVINVDATIFTRVFLTPHTIVQEGRLADLPAGTDFSATTDGVLYEVQTCDKIPDIRNRAQEYEAGLVRASDVLPRG